MIEIHDELYKDFEAVKKIPIVPTMLEVICRTTGLGFSAIARVTNDRWLACSVRDEVKFGLEEGGELKIETTICNEIRDHHKAVVIDHVAKDEQYKEHHTPKMYGLQSYISYPIILKNGKFFGTLCAIGTEPALLENPKVKGTFLLFTELLSFYLESLELMERSHSALHETNRELSNSKTENLLYQKISDHNLQEPLRKITLFSDILVNNTNDSDMEKAKATASKINALSQELISMVQQITIFSELTVTEPVFEPVNLDMVVNDAVDALASELNAKQITIEKKDLPEINAIPAQMSQLFFQLINHAITFSKNDASSVIKVFSKTIEKDEVKDLLPAASQFSFCEICIEHNGMGMEKYNVADIFDIFLHSTGSQTAERYGTGLANCRKIVYNHGGSINARPLAENGVYFSMILPVNYKKETTPSKQKLSINV